MQKIEPYKGIASTYDEIRPAYPPQLILDVISNTGITPDNNLLEIGAGTGKATLQFAEKGFKIHAVEIGEDMAALLKEKCAPYPKVSITISAFESFEGSQNHKYDMIYCAQAFHWLDKDIKYKKCHELLKDDGCLVLFWYNPCNLKSQETLELEAKIDKIVKNYSDRPSPNETAQERRSHQGGWNEEQQSLEIESSRFFELIEKLDYTGSTQNNAAQYIKAMKSVPAFASILDGLNPDDIKAMEAEIQSVINSNGGHVDTLFNYSLYIAKKINSI